MSAPIQVKTKDALLAAVNSNVAAIQVVGVIDDVPTVRLRAGQSIRGEDLNAGLRFSAGLPGLMLHSNNHVQSLNLWSDETQIALGFSDEAHDLGNITVSDVKTIGRVHLEAQQAMQGDLALSNIHVAQADARIAAHHPQGYGVEVLLGGLSVYNSSKNANSRWTLKAHNLSGGSKDQPLRGSGIFIFGGDYIAPNTDPATAPGPNTAGGKIQLTELTTGPVFNNGGIPAGIGNLITGGVFIGSGVHAQQVTCQGSVTTFGPNDMVLDNWGSVIHWQANAALESHAQSGIGFVNFGDLDHLQVDAPITTYGLGARGFNLYDGTLKTAQFTSITTHGDGAIGIQIAKPFGSITVKNGVITYGGVGQSLVRGKVVSLSAHAISLKPGAKGDLLEIVGEAQSNNHMIKSLDLEDANQAIKDIIINGNRK